MILKLHSDSSYLNAVGARSPQGGHLYLGNKSEPDILNGAVLNLAAIMKMVLSSAAEAEFGALFHNTKEATPLRTTLEELGHPQPPTPVLVDNSTAVGLANDTVTQRRSRAIDMRFYWVRDRVNQQQYHVYWVLGNTMWRDALVLEMFNVGAAIEILEKSQSAPLGWKRASGHLIWDVKMDFTRKARWVLDGHKTPNPIGSTFAGMVSRESV